MPTNQVSATVTRLRGIKRPSAVSQALRALRDEVDRSYAKWPFTDRGGKAFRISVATDADTRRRAAELAHRVYRKSGYVSEDESAREHMTMLERPNVFTLLAEDEWGRSAGTVSLVFDSQEGLPCDEIFHNELEGLRARGRRMAEVTRLAIGEDHARSKALLVHMFDFIFSFAFHVKGCTDFIIEVNPRHSAFYRRLLSFETAGPVRPCPRVQDAPAELLRLDLSAAFNSVVRVHANAGPRPRSLFAYFYPPEKAWRVCRYLARCTGDAVPAFPLASRESDPATASAELAISPSATTSGR